MTVAELITELQKYNPDAQVHTWAHYENGEPMDDVAHMVTLGKLFCLPNGKEKEAEDVFINVTVGINPEDIKWIADVN